MEVLTLKENIDTTKITDIKGLDSITVYWEDLDAGRGKVTITCYNKAWTSFWPAMGNLTIKEFFKSCDEHYIAKNLSDIESQIIDYRKISKDTGCEIEEHTLYGYMKEIVECYGPDWVYELPKTSNHEYEYLCKIIKTIQESLGK